jgi:hypothetical protein
MEKQLTTREKSLKTLETSPRRYYKELQAVSIREVIESPVPSLAICRRQLGEMTAKAIVAMILTDTALMFNTGQNMNQDQIVNLTEIILEDYYYMKLDDLKLCFKNAMKGRYGQTYRMDASVILGWLEKYTEERLNEADNVSYENHISTKGESKSETLTQMINRINKKK